MQRIEQASELARSLELVEAVVWADWLDAAPQSLVERLGIRQLRPGSAVGGIAAATDVLMFNRVVALGIDEPVTHARIDELLAQYEDAGVARWMVQWCPQAQPPTTPELLRACGFVHHNNWMKLYRSAHAPLPEWRSDVRVERVGGDRAGTVSGILATSFGFAPELAAWCAAIVDRPGWRTYVAFDGDTAVATGSMFTQGHTAWLGFGATLPEHRARGAQAALTATRIHAAAELGCEIVVVETAEDREEKPAPSFRNMQRFGFEVAYARPNYVMVAGTRGTGIIGENRW